jgi:hypothetical protein
MKTEFRALLMNSAAVSALVGPRVDFGSRVQGDPLPALVLNVISGAEGLTQQGPDGLHQNRVQVDCYALTAGAVEQLSAAVIGLLHGYRGGGFDLVQHVATRDGREGGTNEADRPFRVSLDFETSWSDEE